MTAPNARPLWFSLVLVLLPLWLIASGGAAMWYYFHREKAEARVEQERFVQTVSIPRLKDDLQKFVTVIGERNASSEAAATGLSRTASMIAGLLGPTNTGYAVTSIPGPAEWPMLQVSLAGNDPEAAPVWVVTSYDSRQGSPGAEANATGLAATVAAAQALAHDHPARSIHFVFLPHVNDTESPVLETAVKFRGIVLTGTSPHTVLCVEAMGAGEALWLTSRDVSAVPIGKIDSLGAVYGAEVVCLADDVDLASMLFEMDLPAVRVATRAQLTPDDGDNRLPFAPTVAASTGRLIALIRRCAEK
jgi:hypothetical protein